MDYEPQSNGRLKKLGGALATILIVLVVGAVARVGSEAAIMNFRSSPENFRAEFEDARNSDSAIGMTFDAVERHYPDRYEAFLQEISIAADRGETSEQLHRRGFDFTRNLSLEANNSLQKAPNDSLQAVMKARALVMRTLSGESSRMCADFAQEGLKPSDRPSMSVMTQMGSATAALFEAAAMAEGSLQRYPEPSDEAWFAVGDGMRERGVSEAELGSFADGNLSALPDHRICSLAIALHDTLEAMPQDDGLAVYRAMQVPR